MIYFENASHGIEGFNTHVMSYTLAISFSNFLDRDFYFDFEIPSSTPPAFALLEPFKDRFKILLESHRSMVSDLVRIPNRRIYDIDRDVANKASYQMLYSHFVTTAEMEALYGKTMIWDYFGFGRVALVREQLQEFDLIEWTHTKLSHVSCFYLLSRKEKEALLGSVRLHYLSSVEKLAQKIYEDLGIYNSVHLRLGDFTLHFAEDEYRINVERYRRYVNVAFPDMEIPILVATDGLDERSIFEEIFADYRVVFIDELIFGHYFEEFKSLEFTDFNVLTILNQLLCARGERFIGTYRSTLTGIIHRLRQERYLRDDFRFFPDDRVARLLDRNHEIAADRQGFFEWNKYSIFAEDHNSLGWKREWDFKQTSIGD